MNTEKQQTLTAFTPEIATNFFYLPFHGFIVYCHSVAENVLTLGPVTEKLLVSKLYPWRQEISSEIFTTYRPVLLEARKEIILMPEHTLDFWNDRIPVGHALFYFQGAKIFKEIWHKNPKGSLEQHFKEIDDFRVARL